MADRHMLPKDNLTGSKGGTCVVPVWVSASRKCGYKRGMTKFGPKMPKLLKADGIYGERRLARRYGVDLELRYSLCTVAGEVEAGAGVARDISRSGVLLECQNRLAVRRPVELVIAWPFRLQNICQLELVVTGETVRSEGGRAAVRATDYRFRTRGSRGFEEQPAGRRRVLATA